MALNWFNELLKCQCDKSYVTEWLNELLKCQCDKSYVTDEDKAQAVEDRLAGRCPDCNGSL